MALDPTLTLAEQRLVSRDDSTIGALMETPKVDVVPRRASSAARRITKWWGDLIGEFWSLFYKDRRFGLARTYQELTALGTNAGVTVGDTTRLASGCLWVCTTTNTTTSVWAPTDDYVNVLDFGADPTGTVPSHATISAAITFQNTRGGGRVYVPSGTYLIDVHYLSGGSVRLRSYVSLELSPAAVLQAVPTSNGQYAVVWAYNVEHSTISGGQIRGERDEHIGSNAPDGGHGISVFACRELTVRGVDVSNCWGDGMYIRNDPSGNSEDTLSTNIRVSDSSFHGCRRTGFVAVAVDGLFVDRCAFYNNSGANPFAGINLEPNTDGWVRNCVVADCIAYGNEGAGFQTSGVNITFSNCISHDNYNGFQVMDTTGGHGRRVTVSGGRAYNNFRGLRYEDAEDCTFIGLHIYDNEQNGAECRAIDQGEIIGLSFEGVKIRNNGALGLYIDSAPGARVSANVSNHTGQGIYVINSPGTVLRDCVVSSSTSHNIQIENSADCRITGGETSYSGNRGVTVTESSPRCIVHGMISHHNSRDGIAILSADSMITNCIAYANSQEQTQVYDNLLVAGTGGGCLVTGNIALRGVETAYPRAGIRLSAASSINNCLGDNVTRNGAGQAAGVVEVSDNGNHTSRRIVATASTTLNSAGPGETSTTAITVTGAAVGDAVAIGLSSPATAFQATAWVSSTDTVTVRLTNHSDTTPGSGGTAAKVVVFR